MAGEEETPPASRPDSRVSQSADEDDSNSFHDVDESTNNNDNESPAPETTSQPADEKEEREEPKEAEKEPSSPPPDHSLLPPSTTAPVSSTAMSSSTSLHLEQDPPAATTDELVAFLRGQITDLTSQVTSLNGKLVKSYTTRGDLEDTLHDTQEMERQLRKRVKDLEADKEKWTKEIEQGGWVERVSPISYFLLL